MTYDLIIIGTGPAGLTAAIYAKRAELSTLVIERSYISGGQITQTHEVDNYPGLPKIAGIELGKAFRAHADELGADIVTEEVKEIHLLQDGDKELLLGNGATYTCKALIIATGAAPKLLGVEGEDTLTGCGVSYCATCDGTFFKGLDVAVIGGGDVAVGDALYLARICRKVYLIHRRDEFRAAKSLVTLANDTENIEFILDSEVTQILGEDNVESIAVHNKKTAEDRILDLQGVFIAVGNTPNSTLVKDICDLDSAGFIIADETCTTSAPGIFAAGDVRTKLLRQVVTAAADGASAVFSAEHYIATRSVR